MQAFGPSAFLGFTPKRGSFPRLLSLFFFALVLVSLTARAEDPPLRQLTSNTFQIGVVIFDKSARTVRIPAKLNLDSGLIEYFLVATNGKAYESLLATSAQPYHIQLAMLLIGAKGTPDSSALQAAASVPFHVNRKPGDPLPPPPPPLGDPINIDLTWTNDGKIQHLTAANALRNLETKTNAAPGTWTYTGSRVVKGTFIAQRDGSIVSIIDDIDAMMSNPRSGHDNDQIWEINSNALPPLGAPIEITIKLEDKK